MSVLVKADVFDIRGHTPDPNDVFLVDTQVWFWTTYTRASMSDFGPANYQTRFYPQFIKAARERKCKLYACPLSFSELAYRIERSEFSIFSKSKRPTEYKSVTEKTFRHLYSQEREGVVEEITAAWNQVASMSELLDTTLDASLIELILRRIREVCLDGYDLFMCEAAMNKGIFKVLTDDSDFCTVEGLQVFTANLSAIQSADRLRRLRAR